MLDMISIFLNLPRLTLLPRMWLILGNVPCALEMNVYCALGWNALQISIKFIYSKVSFKACVSLLIFCLDDLYIDESEVLKSASITVLLSISPFMFVSICLICWGAPILGCIYIYNCYIFFLDWNLDHYVVSWRRLESPLDCKEIKPVNPKGNQSWIFIGRTDAEAETPIFWPPDVKNQLIGKDPDAGKDWRQEEKVMTEDEMIGWHHQHDGDEFK